MQAYIGSFAREKALDDLHNNDALLCIASVQIQGSFYACADPHGRKHKLQDHREDRRCSLLFLMYLYTRNGI